MSKAALAYCLCQDGGGLQNLLQRNCYSSGVIGNEKATKYDPILAQARFWSFPGLCWWHVTQMQ